MPSKKKKTTAKKSPKKVVKRVVEIVEVPEDEQEEVVSSKTTEDKEVKPESESTEEQEEEQEQKEEQEEEQKEEQDLSRYTIGSSGSAPVQETAPVAEPAEKENSKKKKVVGFGLSPKLEDVIEDDIPLERRNRRLYFFGIILTAFVLGATSATLYFRIQQGELGTDEVTTEVEEVAQVVEENSATPEPTTEPLARSEITLEILNGSGTSGLAGETADIFEELGYEIYDTGNAEDTIGNQLYTKKDLDESALKYLLDDVKAELNITEITAELTDLDAVAKIVLGSQAEESEEASDSAESSE